MNSIEFYTSSYISAQTASSVYTELFSFKKGEALSVHGHEFLEIGITLNGNANHNAEGTFKKLEKGMVYIIPIGSTHQADQTNDWEVRNIYLLPTIFSAHFFNMDSSTYYKLQDFLLKHCSGNLGVIHFSLKNETFSAIKSLSGTLCPELFSDKNTYTLYQNHCLSNILLLLAEDYYAQYAEETFYTDPRMNKISQFIYAHLDFPLKNLLQGLSEELTLNSQYINRIVKKSLGVPISRYFLQCKIEKSIQLLQNGLAPTEVAFLLGFYDYAHFHKAFTRYVGMTPNQYRLK